MVTNRQTDRQTEIERIREKRSLYILNASLNPNIEQIMTLHLFIESNINVYPVNCQIDLLCGQFDLLTVVVNLNFLGGKTGITDKINLNQLFNLIISDQTLIKLK